MSTQPRRDPTKWTTTNCPTCGKSFEFLKSWPRKFCSNLCAGKALVGNIKHFAKSRATVACQQCGTAFETTPGRNRGRFCSRACFGRWLSANWRGEAHPAHGKRVGRKGTNTMKPCEVCGTDFKTKPSHAERRRTCSRKCGGILYGAAHSGEGNPHWKGGYEPYYGPSWRKAQRAARQRDKVCQHCGMTRAQNGKALDVHHVKPFRTFGVERHIEANDLSNLITLCPACHKKAEPKAA